MMAIDPTYLLQTLRVDLPLIGVYDAPDHTAFEPLVDPGNAERVCLFSFFEAWRNGKTLHLTREKHGCRGCGYWLFGASFRTREEFIHFLVDDEGLKASHDLMGEWLDVNQPYQPEHGQLLIGPLREGQEPYLKTITFLVNPDQLSALLLGAQYNHKPGRPAPVLAPFGSGCMEILPLFDDLSIPQGVIGATDIAMRHLLPPDLMAFTVTVPLYEQLCELDKRSFLDKPFWHRLIEARDD